MIEIAFALNDAKFNDIKDSTTAKQLWEKLTLVYGGDDNVRRSKDKNLRGKYDDRRMKEGENVAQYIN